MSKREKEKKQKNNSGPAIFMDAVVIIMVAAAAACFALHYSGVVRHGAVLWTGVSAFTIVYHFKLRLIMGEWTKKWGITYKHPWFHPRRFEKKLYKLLRVRSWRGKVLTYDPSAFDVKTRTYEEIANAMSKAECDHLINELISLSTLLFGLIWGEMWIFALTAVVGMLFDAQFILVQRYNRPTVVRLIERGKVRG